MPDLHHAARALIEPPLREPEHLAALERRIARRRHRRRLGTAGLGAVLTLVVSLAALSSVRAPSSQVVSTDGGSSARSAPSRLVPSVVPEGFVLTKVSEGHIQLSNLGRLLVFGRRSADGRGVDSRVTVAVATAGQPTHLQGFGPSAGAVVRPTLDVDGHWATVVEGFGFGDVSRPARPMGLFWDTADGLRVEVEGGEASADELLCVARAVRSGRARSGAPAHEVVATEALPPGYTLLYDGPDVLGASQQVGGATTAVFSRENGGNDILVVEVLDGVAFDADRHAWRVPGRTRRLGGGAGLTFVAQDSSPPGDPAVKNHVPLPTVVGGDEEVHVVVKGNRVSPDGLAMVAQGLRRVGEEEWRQFAANAREAGR